MGDAVRNPDLFLARNLKMIVHRPVFGGKGGVDFPVTRLGKDINCQPVGQPFRIQRFIQAFRLDCFHPIPSSELSVRKACIVSISYELSARKACFVSRKRY
ncbi:hypothetical protein D3C75_883000 [compost metagenome]